MFYQIYIQQLLFFSICRFVGINASDINLSAGRYHEGSKTKLPLDTGFEVLKEILAKSHFLLNFCFFLMKGVGLVVAKGPNCRSQIGNVVGYMKFGAFAEYTVIYCQ